MSKCNEVKETPPPSTNHKKSAARLPIYFLQNSVLVGLWFSIFPRVSPQPVFIKPQTRK